jgi:phosphatidylserine/phosphatidylglycerophosphate/cardiolipin synthase-like enzyme
MLPRLEDAELHAAARNARSIPIVGPQGELMGEARMRIEDKLRALPSTMLERKLALTSAYTGAPLTVGNAAKILLDGPERYKSMFAAIEAARDHVHLESYIFDDVEVGRRLSELSDPQGARRRAGARDLRQRRLAQDARGVPVVARAAASRCASSIRSTRCARACSSSTTATTARSSWSTARSGSPAASTSTTST